MKKLAKYLVVALSFLMINISFAAVTGAPTGLWRTIDDKTGQQKSVVRISLSGGKLSGTIVKVFPSENMQGNVCTGCTGPYQNKSLIGATIMHGLTQDASNPSQWSGGTIVDPKDGKSYRCLINFVSNGQIEVRGYIGVSMFGRSQNWYRVK